MDGFIRVNLKEMTNNIGEERVSEILSSFSCPLSPDIEKFIKKNAIVFAQQGIAQTHLVFSQYKGELKLIGYYTLANKSFIIPSNITSKTLRKKINKFAQRNCELNQYIITAPLIAQIGKNFCDNLNNLITGDELLQMACDTVAQVQMNIGGKIVYLECENIPCLLEFYKSNGFREFSKRELDKDEKEDLYGDYLIQMIKYM